MTQALRVVLADDSVLLREGLARLLIEAGFDVVGQCGTAEDLLTMVRATRPDVAVVDIRMPPTHSNEGLVAADAIRAEYSGRVAVLVLSQYVEPEFALRLVTDGGGGVGYLLKDRVADVRRRRTRPSCRSRPRSSCPAPGRAP
jgi:serine/threonine-protein kinase